jgi:hypothetical protein
VLYHLLPPPVAAVYTRFSRFGIVLVFLLMFLMPGAFRLLLAPVSLFMNAAQSFIRLWV